MMINRGCMATDKIVNHMLRVIVFSKALIVIDGEVFPGFASDEKRADLRVPKIESFHTSDIGPGNSFAYQNNLQWRAIA